MECRYEKIKDFKDLLDAIVNGNKLYYKGGDQVWREQDSFRHMKGATDISVQFIKRLHLLHTDTEYHEKIETPQIFDHTDVWFDMGFRRIDSKEILVHTLTNICTDRVWIYDCDGITYEILYDDFVWSRDGKNWFRCDKQHTPFTFESEEE